MAFSIVGTPGSTAGGSATTTITAPAGIAQNDLILLFVQTETASTAATSTGFTSIGGKVSTLQSMRADLLYKIAGASEPASYTVTGGTGVGWTEIGIIVIRGGATASPIDVSASNADTVNGTSVDGASITTTAIDELVWCAVDWNGNESLTFPTGYTAQLNDSSTGIFIATKTQSASGTTGTVSGTLSAADAWITWHIGIKPAGGGSTFTRTVPSSVALLGTSTRTIPTTAALLATNTRTIAATAALLGTATRTVPSSAALKATNTRTVPTTVALAGTGSSRVVPATVALKATLTRIVPSSAALLATLTRTIPSSVALLSTNTRTIPSSAALKASPTRTVLATAALLATNTRTVPTTVALSAGGTSSRTVPASVALSGTATRSIPASLALLATNKRTVPTSIALLATLTRTVPSSAALLATLSRSVPSSAALKATQTRTIPTSVALFRQSFAGALKGTFVSTSRFLATFTDTSRYKASFLSGIRLKASFSNVSRYSSSFLSGSRLKVSFVRSVTMAQPYSTTDVTATILKFDNSVPTAQTLVVTVTLPDGTTQSFSLAGGTVTNLGGGQYKLTYTTGGVGPHREVWLFTATDGSVGEFENVTYASF